MSAKEYAILIENQLRSVCPSVLGKSDKIAEDPYKQIIQTLSYRISTEKLNRFQLLYHGIANQSLQELINQNYDLDQLIRDLKNALTDN